MPPRLEGIVVPLLTPFSSKSDELDVAALKRLVDRLIAAGVHGLIANAGTSEFYTLDDEERRREAEVVVERVAGRVPVLVGAGATGTKLSIIWAMHAKAIGADGLLIMAPYYAPKSVDQIRRHFVAISDASGLPIMLYNQPAVTQVLLTPDDLVRFVDEANIPWLKLTTRRIEHVPAILDCLGDRVRVFEGVDNLAYPSMANGAVGWVAGPANAIPEFAIELWRLVRVERNLEAAYSLHRRLVPLLDFALDEGVFNASLKEICRLRGLPLGAVRSPNPELAPSQRAQLRRIAEGLGLIGKPIDSLKGSGREATRSGRKAAPSSIGRGR